MAVTDGDRKRCDNLACLCEIPLSQATCSPFCDSPEGRDPATIRCSCGHAACESQMEKQLHGGIGAESP
jgi:acetone carboxylase gamma subunit